MNWIGLALRNSARRRLRTLATLGGVAIAVAALFSLLAFQRGYQAGMQGELDHLGAHVLVVPKEPAENILDLSADGMTAMMATTQKVAKAIDKALSPDGILLKQYNRAPAGQSVFHVHFHIVPRWEGVGLAPHGKVMVQAAVLEPTAAKIRSEL